MNLDHKLVVEIDGVTHDSAEAKIYDAERTGTLEALGFHVVRVTNTDVYENLEGVLSMIDAELNSSR